MSVATISFNFQNARGTLAEIPTLLDGQFYWSEDSQQLFIGTAASGNLAITGSTGVFPISISNVAHKWLNSYDDTTGLFTQSQPGFTDLSGSISTGQIPSSTITVAQINATGTPSSSTFLNGAGQWATPSGGGSVTSVFGRTGAVVAVSGDYTVSEVTGAAPLASPTFTGTVTAPTVDVTTNLELGGTLTDGFSTVGTSGQVLSSTGTKTAWINPSGGAVLSATSSLASADVINSQATPFTLVAGSAGKIIMPISVIIEAISGSNFYTGDSISSVLYNDGGTTLAPQTGLETSAGLFSFNATNGFALMNPVTQGNYTPGSNTIVGADFTFVGGITPGVGPIQTSNITSGSAGSGYAPGDIGLLDGAANGDAEYVVDTVDGGGAVLTFHLDDNGTGYSSPTSGVTTSVESGGGDGTLEFDITAIYEFNGSAKIQVVYYLFTT